MAISRRSSLLALAALGVIAPVGAPLARDKVGAADRTIVPGERIGAIARDSTKASLAQVYGIAQVRDATITSAELGDRRGLLVLPSTRDEVEIIFTEDRKRIEIARVSRKNGTWRTKQGLRVGLSLAEVEKLNGKPFTLSGFGWDLGGYVRDYRGGRLPEGLGIRLATAADLGKDEFAAIIGEKELRSDQPVVRKAAPAVSELMIAFR